MVYRVTLRAGVLLVEADEHRVEGSHHVFRRETVVMGAPRLAVVRRIPACDVDDVTFLLSP